MPTDDWLAVDRIGCWFRERSLGRAIERMSRGRGVLGVLQLARFRACGA